MSQPEAHQPADPADLQPGRGELPALPAPPAASDEPAAGVIAGSVINGDGKLVVLAGSIGELQATVIERTLSL